MSLSILIQTASYTLAIWVISEALRLAGGALIKALSGEAPVPKPYLKLCALCMRLPSPIRHYTLTVSGNVIFRRLKRALWLGCLIVGFCLMYSIVLLKFTNLLVHVYLKNLPN